MCTMAFILLNNQKELNDMPNFYVLLLLLTSLLWGGNFVVGKSLVDTCFSDNPDDPEVDNCSRLPFSSCMVEGKKDSTTTKCYISFVFNGINRCSSI